MRFAGQHRSRRTELSRAELVIIRRFSYLSICATINVQASSCRSHNGTINRKSPWREEAGEREIEGATLHTPDLPLSTSKACLMASWNFSFSRTFCRLTGHSMVARSFSDISAGFSGLCFKVIQREKGEVRRRSRNDVMLNLKNNMTRVIVKLPQSSSEKWRKLSAFYWSIHGNFPDR